MNRKLLSALSVVLSLTAFPAFADMPMPPDLAHMAQRRPIVQIAILLDTSNSMDGLIAQAKAELWRIVHEIGTYQKNGQAPLVQVALYEYGKQSLPASEGFIRQVSPFTTDLDVISEALFALTTNGGDEFCGQVIDRAMGELNWSADPADFRAIFIAGNEPFSQGTVDFHKSVAKAAARHVAVNTIHCGGFTEGAQTGWQEGARLGGGAAWIASFTKRAGPGATIDVPLAHKDALYVRSHYDGMTLTLHDAPLPDEIAVIFCIANRGRIGARVGGLAAKDVEGKDGLR